MGIDDGDVSSQEGEEDNEDEAGGVGKGHSVFSVHVPLEESILGVEGVVSSDDGDEHGGRGEGSSSEDRGEVEGKGLAKGDSSLLILEEQELFVDRKLEPSKSSSSSASSSSGSCNPQSRALSTFTFKTFPPPYRDEDSRLLHDVYEVVVDLFKEVPGRYKVRIRSINHMIQTMRTR